MKTVLVIGASRGIGLAVVKRALERGHAVRAFVCSAGRTDTEDARVERVDGDARSSEDLWPTLPWRSSTRPASCTARRS